MRISPIAQGTEQTAAPIASSSSAAPATPQRGAQLLRQGLAAALFGVCVVAILQALTSWEVIGPLIMPKPSEVGQELGGVVGQLLTNGPAAPYAAETAYAMVISLLVCIVLGIAIGTALSLSRVLQTMLYPYILAFNAAPRIVFAPMFVIWFGFGAASRIAMGISIGMFPIIVATMAGLARSDANLEKLATAAGATRWQKFRKIDLPGALPFIIAGIETASVLATVGVIIGEFTAGSSGLGYLIIIAQDTYNLPRVFALVFVTSTLGIMLNLCVVLLGRRLVFWGRK